MDEIEKPVASEEKPEPTAQESAALHEVPEIEDLEAVSDLDIDFRPPPKLKDYLTSSDAPSRYLMILSLLFGTLALICFSLLFHQYWAFRHNASKLPENAVKIIKLDPVFHEDIGELKIDWDQAEVRIEVVAECSSQETCEELKTKNTEARDLLLPILQNSSQTEILNPNRKLILRQQMANQLNELKLKGSILQVDFTDLTIEPKKK